MNGSSSTETSTLLNVKKIRIFELFYLLNDADFWKPCFDQNGKVVQPILDSLREIKLPIFMN